MINQYIRLHDHICCQQSNFDSLTPGDYLTEEWNAQYPTLVDYLLQAGMAVYIGAADAHILVPPTTLWEDFSAIALDAVGENWFKDILWVGTRDGQQGITANEFKKRLTKMTEGLLPLDTIVMFKDGSWFEYDGLMEGVWTYRHAPKKPSTNTAWEW